MRVRDGHARGNNDKAEYAMPSGTMDIIADDGRTMFVISMCERGIQVSASSRIKHGNEHLSDAPIEIIPRASNVVLIRRTIYK